MTLENPYAATHADPSPTFYAPLTVRGTLSRALSILTERPLTLCLIVVGFWLPAEIASSYMTYHIAEESSNAPLLLDQLFEILIGTFVSGAVIHLSYGSLTKQPLSVGTALWKSLASWPALVATRIMAGILVTIGFALLIVPGFYWMIRTTLVDVVTVVEKRYGSDAVSRSFEMTKQHFTLALLVSGFYFGATMIYLAIALTPQVFFPEWDTFYVDALASTIYDLLGAYFQVCSLVMWSDMKDPTGLATRREESLAQLPVPMQ